MHIEGSCVPFHVHSQVLRETFPSIFLSLASETLALLTQTHFQQGWARAEVWLGLSLQLVLNHRGHSESTKGSVPKGHFCFELRQLFFMETMPHSHSNNIYSWRPGPQATTGY